MKIGVSHLIFITIVFGIILFTATIFFIGLIDTQPIGEPKEFVENMTSVTKSTIFYNYKIIKYPSKVDVVDLRDVNIRKMVGISTESWIFNFGIIPLGDNSAKKTLILNGMSDDRTKIKLLAFGNISSMVSFDKNDFYLKGNDTVSVVLTVSNSTQLGNYIGEIDIVIQRKKFG